MGTQGKVERKIKSTEKREEGEKEIKRLENKRDKKTIE